MTIDITDEMLDNLDGLVYCVMSSFISHFSNIDYVIQKGYINKMSDYYNFYTIDFDFIKSEDVDKIYSSTHVFIHFNDKKMNILSHGQSDLNQKHWDVVVKNLSNFRKKLRDGRVEKMLE